MVGGPLQRILRPAEIEAADLSEALHQHALFGPQKIFDPQRGAECGMQGERLLLSQDTGATIQLDKRGALLLQLPLIRTMGRGRNSWSSSFAIIEEDVIRELIAAIAYADWVLERIDPTHRITHVVLAVSVSAADHLGWRTQAEQDASPNGGSMRMGRPANKPVHADKPRAALRFKAHEVAEDLMVPLRRQRKNAY